MEKEFLEKEFWERVPGGTQGLETLINWGCTGCLAPGFQVSYLHVLKQARRPKRRGVQSGGFLRHYLVKGNLSSGKNEVFLIKDKLVTAIPTALLTQELC